MNINVSTPPHHHTPWPIIKQKHKNTKTKKTNKQKNKKTQEKTTKRPCAMQRPWRLYRLYRFEFLQDPFKILQRNEASAGSDNQNPGFATFVACGSEHSVRNPGDRNN